MDIGHIVSFAHTSTEVESSYPRQERLRKGNPQRKTWNHFSEPSENFNAGEWECEIGAWEVYYPAESDEFCHILSGRMRLYDQHGEYREFSAGDSFVIPGGFIGVWETLQPLKKLYVIAKVRS